MLPCAESLAGYGDDMGLVKQTPGDIGSRVDAIAAEVGRDVGIDIERAFRLDTSNVGDLCQLLQDLITQLNVPGPHFLYTRLRSPESGHGRFLDHVGGAGSVLTLQLGDGVDDRRGSQGIAQPPSG